MSRGVLDSRNTVNLLGKALEPEFGNKLIARLYPGTWDMESFWGQVFTVALTGNEIGGSVASGDGQGDSGSSPEVPGEDKDRTRAGPAGHVDGTLGAPGDHVHPSAAVSGEDDSTAGRNAVTEISAGAVSPRRRE